MIRKRTGLTEYSEIIKNYFNRFADKFLGKNHFFEMKLIITTWRLQFFALAVKSES